SAVDAGANVRPRGEDMREGEIVVGRGTVLHAGEIAVIAACQKSEVSVSRRPRVAILATGDEVIGIDDHFEPGKVIDSNAWGLAALVQECGGEPRVMPVVPDRKDATVAAFENARECDVILSTGGVSAGAYDLVEDALEELGAEIVFRGVAMKPGKPIVFARLGGHAFFGLPGNPVSCMTGFVLFVAPLLRKALGIAGDPRPPAMRARLEGELRSKGDRTTFFRVRVESRDGELVATPMKAQGSGVSTSMVGANGFAVLGIGEESRRRGDDVSVLLLRVL
ncbi:MAG: molybdopterin molybdotransferase MoeA, partial [Thermoanaerobaculia bacterium]